MSNVCKYFLKGTCRYGNNCRYSHPRDQQPLNNQQGTFRSNQNFANQQQFGADQKTSVREIIPVINEDMTILETSRIWPLSCYGYSKFSKCLPGLEDLSPEELRFKAYEAEKNKTFEAHKQWFAVLVREAMQKIQELRNPSGQMRQRLMEFLKTAEAQDSSNSSSSAFGSGATNQSSTFGQNDKSAFNSPLLKGPSAFGGSQSKSVFGGQSSTQTFGSSSFGGFNSQSNATQSMDSGSGAKAGSVFGNTSQQSAGSVFGAASSSSVFGNTSKSAFGSANSQNSAFSSSSTQNSVFGSSSSQNSVFGSSSSQNSQPSVFGANNNQNSSQSAFGSNNAPNSSQSAFASGSSQIPQTSTFGSSSSQISHDSGLSSQTANTQSSFFGSQNSQNSAFASPTNQGGSVFGQKSGMLGTPSQSTAFGGTSTFASSGSQGISQPSTQPDMSNIYSKADQLTSEEMDEFKAAKFTLGKIPTKPPPREVC